MEYTFAGILVALAVIWLVIRTWKTLKGKSTGSCCSSCDKCSPGSSRKDEDQAGKSL